MEYMADEEELTTPAAATYTGVARQTLLMAVKRGEIGRRVEARGTRTGFVYIFTRPELDAWKAGAPERQQRGGRPKKQKITS